MVGWGWGWGRDGVVSILVDWGGREKGKYEPFFYFIEYTWGK